MKNAYYPSRNRFDRRSIDRKIMAEKHSVTSQHNNRISD